MTNSAPSLRLDHVIIGVADLEEATTDFSAVLGRHPSWRGRHPAYGTANVLFRLDNAYLELLAPDPEAGQTTAWTNSLGRFLTERGDGLFSIALATPDAAASAAATRTRGLGVDDPLEGEGVDSVSGAVRRWTNARIAPEGTRGTRSFFIQHLSPADALPPAGPRSQSGLAIGVLGVSIESSDAAGARKMWRDSFGLPELTLEGGFGFDLANARLLLWPGVGEPEWPDRYLHLILQTPTLSALADRLDQEGRRFEQGAFREGEGIMVEVGGAEVLFLESL